MLDVVTLRGLGTQHRHGFVFSAGNLAGAGKTWLRVEDLALLGGVEFYDGGSFWPRANQRHIADQDIPKLGKFVKLCLADEVSDPGDSRIRLPGDRRSAAVGIQNHGTEFQHEEQAAVFSGPPTAIERIPWRIEADRN